jgi:PIN domain nuclease of toxin-antitoxin system
MMTTILVDTHVLLWAQASPHRLSARARELLEDPRNDIAFSVASIWEVAIKASRRKPGFEAHPRRVLHLARDLGFEELPITSGVASRVADLPFHHADPFDRLLIAQALELPARLLTVDEQLAPYSELVVLV